MKELEFVRPYQEENMRSGFFAAVAFMFLLGGYAFGRAQNSNSHTIHLGITTLRIGMPKDSAVALLSSDYNISFYDWLKGVQSKHETHPT